MNLFQKVNFIGHSGDPLTWKIECEALTDEDWEGLALIAVDMGPRFREVIGVPRGGWPFAEALAHYALPEDKFRPLLVVDDVLTTGKSLREVMLRNTGSVGLVVFARSHALVGNSTAIWVRGHRLV